MKVHILLRLVEGPYGGSHQFLKTLRAWLRKNGTYSETPSEADALLFDSSQDLSQARWARWRYPNKKMIHRLDGVATLYNHPNDPRDAQVIRANHLISDGTIVQSQWAKEEFEKLGLNAEYSSVIKNAANPEFFFPSQALSDEPRQRLRVVLSSWSKNWNKGFAEYQEIDHLLDSSDFNQRFEFTFIGNSPVAFKNIRTLPSLAPRELADELRKHHVYWTATQNEACSNSLIEALACGLPVLAKKSGGNPELVGTAGILYSSSSEILPSLIELKDHFQSYKDQISQSSINEIGHLYLQLIEKVPAPTLQKNIMRAVRSLITPWTDSISILAFGITFFTPLILALGSISSTSPDQIDRIENRKLAPLPRLSDGAQYFSALERWFSDHFGFRADLVRLSSTLKIHLFQKSQSKEVIVGKEGWLFYATGDLETYKNSEHWSQVELERWVSMFKLRADWAEKNGILYHVVIAPGSHRIYPEYLPEWLGQAGLPSRAERLKAALSKNGVSVIDLIPILPEFKSKGRLYHRTDTHWNQLGAYWAARAILKKLPEKFHTSSIAEDQYSISFQVGAAGDLARMMGVSHSLSEENLLLSGPAVPKITSLEEKIERNGRAYMIGNFKSSPINGRRLVLTGDSFADGLVPGLANEFSEILTIWKQPFHPDAILKFNPDVWLDEFVERALMGTPDPDLKGFSFR